MSTDLNNTVHRLRQNGYGVGPAGSAARRADIEQLSHALGLAEATIDHLVSALENEVNGPTSMGEPSLPHPDDAAVDRFAHAMKLKLATAREKGRGGWNNDEPGMQQRLSDMLRAHVENGGPRDVANFCMFLQQRGESISPSTVPASSSAPATRPSMQFTLGQAETLLAFFGGANGDMTVEYFPANHWPDSPEAPAGLYVYCTEYPEEGAQWLGEQDSSHAIVPTWQHIPTDAKPAASLDHAVHAYKVASIARMAMETDPDGEPTIAVLEASIREGVRAAMQVTAPTAVPPGYAMVPVEPTEEMLVACIDAWQRRLLKKAENGTLLGGGNPRESFRENYKAMVAATVLSASTTEALHG